MVVFLFAFRRQGNENRQPGPDGLRSAFAANLLPWLAALRGLSSFGPFLLDFQHRPPNARSRFCVYRVVRGADRAGAAFLARRICSDLYLSWPRHEPANNAKVVAHVMGGFHLIQLWNHPRLFGGEVRICTSLSTASAIVIRGPTCRAFATVLCKHPTH